MAQRCLGQTLYIHIHYAIRSIVYTHPQQKTQKPETKTTTRVLELLLSLSISRINHVSGNVYEKARQRGSSEAASDPRSHVRGMGCGDSGHPLHSSLLI